MRTPAGNECAYFYGDYYRGRKNEECRLLSASSLIWKPDLCNDCPVPGILMANACSHLVLEPRLERPFPYIRRRVVVQAFCDKTMRRDFDPHIGCGECHPLPPAFTGDDRETNTAA